MQDEDTAACDDEDPMADDEFELEMEREFQRRADDAEKMGRLSAAVADRDQGIAISTVCSTMWIRSLPFRSLCVEKMSIEAGEVIRLKYFKECFINCLWLTPNFAKYECFFH